ncbi:MAG TPA: hypothetical protein VF867_14075 [Arthrobacter sp.]
MTFHEQDHPRGSTGRFTPTGHTEPAISLAVGLSDTDFSNHLRELSDGNVSADRGQDIEGVKAQWCFGFNNEDDMYLHVVIPDDGEPFSVLDYGIHIATYPDGPGSDEEDAPPARTVCVLAVPAEKRKGVDLETLARAFRSAGRYTNPEWADEDDDTGQEVWDAAHARLVADLGVPAS